MYLYRHPSPWFLNHFFVPSQVLNQNDFYNLSESLKAHEKKCKRGHVRELLTFILIFHFFFEFLNPISNIIQLIQSLNEKSYVMDLIYPPHGDKFGIKIIPICANRCKVLQIIL